MMQRPKLVVGNWKMHGSLADNEALLAALLQAGAARAGGAAVCVPYPYLAQARDRLAQSPLAWGAQDVSEYERGAYTGEVSAAMLAEFGCRYVIAGHSERRALYGETSAVVAAKAGRALAAGLTPIVCVGESLAEREAGQTLAVVGAQLAAVLDVLGVDIAKVVLAYEPVWAIGTGKTASPEQAQDVHRALRGMVATRYAEAAAGLLILYGGSVKPGNAAELFAMPDIDGGLIGGASLVAADFAGILSAAAMRSAH